MAASAFQAAALVASPSYPNAVAWSHDNLVAVASGHLVTILNPANLLGPRGLVMVPSSTEPFQVGIIDRKDLLSGSMLPIALSRDIRPCVCSISWSPIGLAPNSGCLLAVCTTQGRIMLYRMPFCEFSAEWMQVADISEMLYAHLLNVNFGESGTISAVLSNDQTNHAFTQQESADDQSISVQERRLRRKVVEAKFDNLIQHYSNPSITGLDAKGKSRKNIPESCSFPLITAEQYASRISMLSSRVVSWSPMVLSKSIGCSILAVGGKSGDISFWRVDKPLTYSVRQCEDLKVLLIGLLKAHNSWITTASWVLSEFESSNPLLLLVTGSSDGSVKIWWGNIGELLKSSDNINVRFSLLSEVVSVKSVPVSVLSLHIPVKSPWKLLLAAGKGSGSFEVWLWDFQTSKLEDIGSYEAHDHVVTGLVWAFDGGCLYSCSQDNTLHSWIFDGNTPCKVPIPSNTPGVKSLTDVPNVFDSCYGLALSPGNLVVALAHGFDADLLNPMYQARSLKAAVEFLWIGGQQLGISSSGSPDFDAEDFPGFPVKELVYWESNILWLLNQYEHLAKPLVMWDVVAALLAFKQSRPAFVNQLLLKWLQSCIGSPPSHSTTILLNASGIVSTISSRQLHIINILCRRVILTDMKADKINNHKNDLNGSCGAEGEQLVFWIELLWSSERELRERLVCISFAAVLSLLSDLSSNLCQSQHWQPVGLAQMEQWVALCRNHVKHQSTLLASEVGKLDKSQLQTSCEYVAEEQCRYCAASVPFESTEAASCRGVKCDKLDEEFQSHRLARCAVSMQVCPTSPTWFCMCCNRPASTLAPTTLFRLSRFPSDLKSFVESSEVEVFSEPLCPFCGILLQRLQPEFLLSLSPV